jgi:hypothetical protein
MLMMNCQSIILREILTRNYLKEIRKVKIRFPKQAILIFSAKIVLNKRFKDVRKTIGMKQISSKKSVKNNSIKFATNG